METGSIFKFKLPHDFGYAYCKLINYSKLSSFFGYHIKVYDYFDNGEVDNADFFKGKDYYLNTIPICKQPTLRGKYSWKLLGVLSEKTDSIVPCFKSPNPQGFAFDTYKQYFDSAWEIAQINDYTGSYHFNQVQHLEELYVRSTISVEVRVAMELLREKKEDIGKYFDLMESPDRLDYDTMRFIPLYKTLPDAIREKPLSKGIVPDKYLDFDFNKLLPKGVITSKNKPPFK